MKKIQEIKIHFLGASATVTGSKFLLETSDATILIDCGLFQGLKELREINWKPFGYPPSEIDLVILTHGHLDHTGYLPKLIKQGYKAPIIGTAPTLAIASVILRDSAQIQEEEAKKTNDDQLGTHQPALPLYTIFDAEKTIGYFKAVQPNIWINHSKTIRYRLNPNGHIIGSTFIELEIYGKTFIFSGDVGRKEDPLLKTPLKPQWADILFLEGTYGNRLHPKQDADKTIIDAVYKILKNKGTLIIPSFAVERLQTLMYKLWKLYISRKIPNIPVFIDSPMGNDVLQIFETFPSWHKISLEEIACMKKHFKIITSYQDTQNTIDDKRSKIVVAGSGMVTGGRVLTYLSSLLDKSENIVLLAGFQAEGTRGRQLLEGAYELKIFGRYIPVKAQILHIENLSAHADQQELLEWLSEIKNIPEQVFLIHGEKLALDALRVKIKDSYKWKVHIPSLYEIFTINLSD